MRSSLSKIEQHAQSLHETDLARGARRVADLVDREVATVVGTIRSLTLRPSSGVRALEADIEDGTGRVLVVWLGRRSIAGVQPGSDIEVHGLMSHDSRGWHTYNPSYRLLSVSR